VPSIRILSPRVRRAQGDADDALLGRQPGYVSANAACVTAVAFFVVTAPLRAG
jgi:hypothetical protein